MNTFFRSKSNRKIKDVENAKLRESPSPPESPIPPSQPKPKIGALQTPFIYLVYDLQIKMNNVKIIYDDITLILNDLVDHANELKLLQIA